jgi:methylphosphotriester-DNA--protein-cysteine methyltransferase
MSLLLPGTGAELMFHYGAPVAIRTVQGRRPSLGSAYLLCARNAPHQPLPQGGVGFVSVRFRSGALRHFCPLPLVALLDDAVPIADIWGASGREIAERVALAPCREDRVEALQDWLQACLARYGETQPAIEMALRALYYRHRDARIESLAERIGMSRRHFERVFREKIGLTPKSFQRIARFHHTVRELMLAGRKDYLGSALDHGYYDQAHFIHDFTGLVGRSPGSFLQDALRSAHFYNRPLFSADKVGLPR